ncbi:MAG: hypothetical protein K2R98_16210 [Gemmataceae bacterium]|nr:hypothetical protein [Gemmataceae bacterium]
MSFRPVRLVSLPCLVLLAAWWTAVPMARSDDPKPKADLAKDLVVKYVTLQESDTTLSKVLEKLKAQTDIEVVRQGTEDPRIAKLKLEKVTFWKALDAIAREADMRVNLYQRDGKMALVQGPYHEVPTSYSGPFRVVLKRIMTIRDLETDAHACVARVEIAWQPPFQAFLLETKPDTIVLQDDKGLDQKVPKVGKGQSFVDSGRNAMEIDIPLPALRRSVQRIGVLKGQMNMVGSGRQLTFKFDALKKDKREQEGVNIEIANFEGKKNADGEMQYVVNLSLKYPASTFKFESFQIGAWLVRNKAYLVNKAGMKFTENAGFDSDDVSATQVVVNYRWVDDADKKFVLGKPDNWKFEYLTPGPVIEVPIPFEFKDVDLP